jgi:cell division septation protein DedD
MFMDFKFGKGSADGDATETPGEKKKLLVLLLILVGGFAYIYLFTDLIKPKTEAAKPAEAPAAQQSAKIPLPPRNPDSDAAGDKSPEKKEAEKPLTVASKPALAPTAAKPAAAPAAPAAKPATVVAAAKAPAAPAPPKAAAKAKAEAPKKAEAAKPAEKKAAAPTADKKPAAPAAKVAEKKDGKDVKKGASDKAKEEPKKTTPAGQVKPEAVAKATKSESDAWIITVGNYVLEETLATDMGRVRKAGFEPFVKPSARKKSAMNRLFVAEFADRPAAQSALEKLQRQTSDAFVIDQGGKFVLFAGSYLQSESATSEKERLKAAGVSVTIKHTEIAIPSQSITVGPFSAKKAADAALTKLKSAGLKASLAQK